MKTFKFPNHPNHPNINFFAEKERHFILHVKDDGCGYQLSPTVYMILGRN
jgi:hypothetical protein